MAAVIRLQYDRILQQENISVHTFKYWKYKLAGSRNSEAASHDLLKISEPAKLVPVKVAEEVAELPEFSHVKTNKSSDIYIRIGSKSSLIIPDNFKAETLLPEYLECCRIYDFRRQHKSLHIFRGGRYA